MARYKRKKRKVRVPRNAVGVIKTRGGYRFVVKGKKVPKSLLKKRKKTRRRRTRRRK